MQAFISQLLRVIRTNTRRARVSLLQLSLSLIQLSARKRHCYRKGLRPLYSLLGSLYKGRQLHAFHLLKLEHVQAIESQNRASCCLNRLMLKLLVVKSGAFSTLFQNSLRLRMAEDLQENCQQNEIRARAIIRSSSQSLIKYQKQIGLRARALRMRAAIKRPFSRCSEKAFRLMLLCGCWSKRSVYYFGSFITSHLLKSKAMGFSALRRVVVIQSIVQRLQCLGIRGAKRSSFRTLIQHVRKCRKEEQRARLRKRHSAAKLCWAVDGLLSVRLNQGFKAMDGSLRQHYNSDLRGLKRRTVWLKKHQAVLRLRNIITAATYSHELYLKRFLFNYYSPLRRQEADQPSLLISAPDRNPRLIALRDQERRIKFYKAWGRLDMIMALKVSSSQRQVFQRFAEAMRRKFLFYRMSKLLGSYLCDCYRRIEREFVFRLHHFQDQRLRARLHSYALGIRLLHRLRRPFNLVRLEADTNHRYRVIVAPPPEKKLPSEQPLIEQVALTKRRGEEVSIACLKRLSQIMIEEREKALSAGLHQIRRVFPTRKFKTIVSNFIKVSNFNVLDSINKIVVQAARRKGMRARALQMLWQTAFWITAKRLFWAISHFRRLSLLQQSHSQGQLKYNQILEVENNKQSIIKTEEQQWEVVPSPVLQLVEFYSGQKHYLKLSTSIIFLDQPSSSFGFMPGVEEKGIPSAVISQHKQQPRQKLAMPVPDPPSPLPPQPKNEKPQPKIEPPKPKKAPVQQIKLARRVVGEINIQSQEVKRRSTMHMHSHEGHHGHKEEHHHQQHVVTHVHGGRMAHQEHRHAHHQQHQQVVHSKQRHFHETSGQLHFHEDRDHHVHREQRRHTEVRRHVEHHQEDEQELDRRLFSLLESEEYGRRQEHNQLREGRVNERRYQSRVLQPYDLRVIKQQRSEARMSMAAQHEDIADLTLARRLKQELRMEDLEQTSNQHRRRGEGHLRRLHQEFRFEEDAGRARLDEGDLKQARTLKVKRITAQKQGRQDYQSIERLLKDRHSINYSREKSNEALERSLEEYLQEKRLGEHSRDKMRLDDLRGLRSQLAESTEWQKRGPVVRVQDFLEENEGNVVNRALDSIARYRSGEAQG